MQSDPNKGASTVLTETDMVALLTVASQRKYEPGVMVSRDHPFIPAAGLIPAWSAGGSCSTSTAGSAQEASQSPATPSPFSCNPNGLLRIVFTASETANESDRHSQHTCESNAGESSSNTCLLPTPQSRYVEGIPFSES